MSFPAVPIFDTFTGAQGDLNAHLLDGGVAPNDHWYSPSWQPGAEVDGSGHARGLTAGTASILWTFEPATGTDYGGKIRVKKLSEAGEIGVVLAVAGDPTLVNNYMYIGRYNAATGAYEICKMTAGTIGSPIASQAGSLADADDFEFVRAVAGGNAALAVKKNGATVLSYTDTAPASQFLAPGQFGIYIVPGTPNTTAGFQADRIDFSGTGSGAATAYTLAAPSPASGVVNVASGNFTVTPNGTYTGTITIIPSGGGLSSPIVKTFSASSAPQTFTITPTVVGTVTLTPTNSGGLTNPSAVTYTVTAAPSAAPNTDFWELGAGLTGLVGTVGVTLYTINSAANRTLYRARTTAGISEDPDVPGIYHVVFPAGFAGVALLDTGGSPPALVVPLKVGVGSAAEVFAWPVGGGTFGEAVAVMAGVHGGQVVDSADHGVSTVYAFKDPTTTVLVTANTAVRRTITSTP